MDGGVWLIDSDSYVQLIKCRIQSESLAGRKLLGFYIVTVFRVIKFSEVK